MYAKEKNQIILQLFNISPMVEKISNGLLDLSEEYIEYDVISKSLF